jgi:hypothetical protein
VFPELEAGFVVFGEHGDGDVIEPVLAIWSKLIPTACDVFSYNWAYAFAYDGYTCLLVFLTTVYTANYIVANLMK